MKLTYGILTVEGNDEKEIEFLLSKIEALKSAIGSVAIATKSPSQESIGRVSPLTTVKGVRRNSREIQEDNERFNQGLPQRTAEEIIAARNGEEWNAGEAETFTDDIDLSEIPVED